MTQVPESKSSRLLEIYSRLGRGESLNKHELSKQYQVSPRSIQRDMGSIRCFLSDQMLMEDVVLDQQSGGYRLIETA